MNCSSQALLLDLGTSLDPSAQPRRLQFAQSSLLWQLAKTEDLTIVKGLRTFVSSLDFTGVPDGAVALDLTQSERFRVASAGWTFDFAALEVKAPVVGWIEDASPNAFQQSLVGTVGASALERISTLAAGELTRLRISLSARMNPDRPLRSFLSLLHPSRDRSRSILDFDPLAFIRPTSSLPRRRQSKSGRHPFRRDSFDWIAIPHSSHPTLLHRFVPSSYLLLPEPQR